MRLLFLTTHYHQPFNFTFEGLDQAKQTLDKFYNALLRVKDVKTVDAGADKRIVDALEDDLNTPLALSYIHELVNNLNKAETESEKVVNKTVLLKSAELLGILYQNPEKWFKGDIDEDVEKIEALITERALAKKNKDYATADAIRSQLSSMGIVLEDGAGGVTTWKKG